MVRSDFTAAQSEYMLCEHLVFTIDCMYTFPPYPHTCRSKLMRQCWREDPKERPTFSQLSAIVERLLTSIAGYTELGMVLLNTSQEAEQLG